MQIIEGALLCNELIRTRSFVKKLKNPTPPKILNFMKKYNTEDLYPNTCFFLILLTVSVSVASGERSFSELKTH
jgi:hypothetical protein